MKHVTIVDNTDGNTLNDLINNWIEEHEEEILEVIDIDYQQYGSMYTATVTYEERK
ncbi:hypothetical protein [Dethiothermospora halolimnae]|uniref:hypothetical protein n=1 Tax=Dethiothermospora halolimnae TaxID=3114390 RepID=UPI003CCC1320